MMCDTKQVKCDMAEIVRDPFFDLSIRDSTSMKESDTQFKEKDYFMSFETMTTMVLFCWHFTTMRHESNEAHKHKERHDKTDFASKWLMMSKTIQENARHWATKWSQEKSRFEEMTKSQSVCCKRNKGNYNERRTSVSQSISSNDLPHQSCLLRSESKWWWWWQFCAALLSPSFSVSPFLPLFHSCLDLLAITSEKEMTTPAKTMTWIADIQWRREVKCHSRWTSHDSHRLNKCNHQRVCPDSLTLLSFCLTSSLSWCRFDFLSLSSVMMSHRVYSLRVTRMHWSASCWVINIQWLDQKENEHHHILLRQLIILPFLISNSLFDSTTTMTETSPDPDSLAFSTVLISSPSFFMSPNFYNKKSGNLTNSQHVDGLWSFGKKFCQESGEAI